MEPPVKDGHVIRGAGREADHITSEVVPLFSISNDGKLHQYPKVTMQDMTKMPSSGQLTNPDDIKAVAEIEATMIRAHGHRQVWLGCGRGESPRAAFGYGGGVSLQAKMLRAMHVPTLRAAVVAHGVVSLNLTGNQLGVQGALALAGILKHTQLRELRCAGPALPAARTRRAHTNCTHARSAGGANSLLLGAAAS